MILEGKITRVLGTKEGVSQSGRAWKKAMYLLETNDKYPKTIAFSVFGDKTDEIVFLPEQEVRLGVDIESKEWSGKWYTEVTCFAELDTEKTQEKAAEPALGRCEPAPTDEQLKDELPF